MRRMILLGLVLLAAGCASSRELVVETQPFEQLVEQLADPAMQGRGLGTQGLDDARDLIVAHFQTLGLEPAFTQGYTQPIDIPLGAQATTQQLSINGHPLTPGREEDFTVLGFSGSGAFAGEAVFVGYAITDEMHDYDSLAGDTTALRGKVAVAYRYEPMDAEGRSRWTPDGAWSPAARLTAKAQWAAQRGAVALLIVNPPSRDDGAALRSTVHTAFGQAADLPVYHVSSRAFVQLLKAGGRDAHRAMRIYETRSDEGKGNPDALGVTIQGRVQVDRPHAVAHNVAAMIPGCGALKDEAVIIGAHYDHLGFGEFGSLADSGDLHPGADDNASGTAAVMLLAEQWAKRTTQQDRRTLVFLAFSGEELGLIGSNYLVAHADELAFDLENVAAMLNFDMIGRMRGDVLFVMAGDSASDWPGLIAAANQSIGLHLSESGHPVGPSDHTAFYLAGIPVLHFFTGIHSDYHRPSDTPEKVNARGAMRIIAFVDQLLDRLVHGPGLNYIALEEIQTDTDSPAILGHTP